MSLSGGGVRAASATMASAPAPSSSTTTLASSLPMALGSTTPSEEMRSLFDGQKKLHDQILKLQSQIEEEEAVYLEETAHGNIIRGWDGFIDSKQSRKEAALKKVKPYTESEHLFSNCCDYKTQRSEPSLELAGCQPKEESNSSRRRAAAAAAASTASTTGASGVTPTNSTGIGRPSSSSSLVSSNPAPKLSAVERKHSFSGSSGASTTGSATLGRPPKIKKRKRLDRLEIASTASATQSETGDDDDKEMQLLTMTNTNSTATSVKKSRPSSLASGSETPDSGDFLDMV